MALYHGAAFEDERLGRDLPTLSWELRLAFSVLIQIVNDLQTPIPSDPRRAKEVILDKVDAWDSLERGDVALWADVLGTDCRVLKEKLMYWKPSEKERYLAEQILQKQQLNRQKRRYKKREKGGRRRRVFYP